MQKAKIICIVLAVVLVSSGAVLLITNFTGDASVVAPPPEDTISTSMERPLDGVFDKNDAKSNLYIAHGELLRSGGFKGVNKGTSTSLGISQQVYSYRTVVGKNVFKQSVSDGLVKMGSQTYIWGDNYILRDVEKVRGIEDVTWKNTARKVSKETYDETYGYHFAGLTGYILNDETILSATLEKEENGIYTYRYVLDEKVAPYYVLYEMRTNAGTKGFATFEKAEIVVEIDENWQLQTLSTDCKYNVPMLGGVPCEEHMTEVFSDFGYNGDLPEKEFFEQYFDAEISAPAVKEPDATSMLLDMFEQYLIGNDLNVAVNVSKGDAELIKAKLRAKIDINNLENIAADIVVGDELYLSYEQGKLFVTYQDFKGSVTLDGVMSLVSTLINPSGSSLNINADELLGGARFTADGARCVVNLPITLSEELTADVSICGSAYGESYTFTNANVKLGDISINLELCNSFNIPERSGEYPDILGLLDVIDNNVLAFDANIGEINASIAYDIANNKLAATLDDLQVSMQNETIYASLGEVKLKVALSDVKILASVLGDVLGGGTSALPAMPQTVEEILAMLSDITATNVDNGVAFALNLGDITAAVELVRNNAKWNLSVVKVSLGEMDLSLTPSSEPVSFPQIDEDKFVDATELAISYIGPISSLLTAKNYGVDFAVTLEISNSTYDVYGNALYDEKGNLNVAATVLKDNIVCVKADVVYAENVVYLDVNGIKVAFDTTLGEEINLEQIIGLLQQNEEIAAVIEKLMTLVDKFTQFDWATLDIARLISSFGFADGKLSIGVDASSFDLGAFDVDVYSNGAKLAVDVNGLSLGNVELSASVKAYSSKNTVAVPNASDYVTELKVDAFGYTAYVALDVYNMSVSAYVENLFGARLDVLLLNEVVYAVYGDVKVKFDISDVDKLLAVIAKFTNGEESSMPVLDVDLNAIINSLLLVNEGDGYSLSVAIGEILAGVSFDANAEFTTANVQFGDVQIVATRVENVEFATIDTNDEYIDIIQLADCFADDVLSLINANGYKIDFQGSFAFGSETFGIVANVNYNNGLYIEAEIAHNNAKIIVAKIHLVENVLFLDIDGIRAAVNIASNGAKTLSTSLQDTLRQFLDYNVYADKLINLVLDVTAQFDVNNIGTLLSGLTFDGDNAIITLDGSVWGISAFTCSIAKGLNVAIGGLNYEDMSLDVSASVSASDEQVVAPNVDDYKTNLKIAVDEQNTIYANLDLINNVYMLRLDDLNVLYENGVIKLYFYNKESNSAVQLKVNFANLQSIIDKFNNLAGDNAQLDGDMFSSFDNIDVKAIIKSLTLSFDALTNTSTVGASFAGINAVINFLGGETPSLQVELPIAQLKKTFIVTADEQRDYHNYAYDNESDYIAIEDVIDDYYDVLESLVKDNKSWYFSLQATLIDNAKGITYQVNDGSYVEFIYDKGNDERATEISFRAKLDISKRANNKTTRMAIEVAMFNGRVYFNYNGLKVTVAIDAIKGCLTDDPNVDLITAITNCINDITNPDVVNQDSLINRLMVVVPQIKQSIVKAMEAKNDLENLNIVRYQDIIKLFSYNRDTHDLDIVINGGIFLQDLCNEVALSVNKQNGYLHLANLSLGYGRNDQGGFNTELNNVSALVMSKTLEQATADITGYDVSNHINLDSIKELLTAFVNTATPLPGTNVRSFHIAGTVPVEIVLLGTTTLDMELYVDIDEVNDVFIAVKLGRGLHDKDSTTLFADNGGYSYLYYDGSLDKENMPEAEPFRVTRNSIYYYCTECGEYRVNKSLHSHYHFPKFVFSNEKRYESEVNNFEYDKTFTTKEFTDNILTNIVDLFNFNSTVAKTIKGIEIGNTEMQIEKILKDYKYVDNSFNLDLDLSSMVSNSSASVRIAHNSDFELTNLSGNANIFGAVKATFDLNLIDGAYGIATDCVKSHPLW